MFGYVIKTITSNALKYKILGAVFVPCRIALSFLRFLAALVALR